MRAENRVKSDLEGREVVQESSYLSQDMSEEEPTLQKSGGRIFQAKGKKAQDSEVGKAECLKIRDSQDGWHVMAETQSDVQLQRKQQENTVI